MAEQGRNSVVCSVEQESKDGGRGRRSEQENVGIVVNKVGEKKALICLISILKKRVLNEKSRVSVWHFSNAVLMLRGYYFLIGTTFPKRN